MVWLFRFGAAIDCLSLLIIWWPSISRELGVPCTLSKKRTRFIALFGVGLVLLSFYLKNNHYLWVATVLVWLPGLPLLIYGLTLVRALITKPTWK